MSAGLTEPGTMRALKTGFTVLGRQCLCKRLDERELKRASGGGERETD